MSLSYSIPVSPSTLWDSFTRSPWHWKPSSSISRVFSSPLCRRVEDDYHSTLKALQSRGRFPRKSLGQHYMLNSAVNEELVKEAKVKDGEVVLEIGPGTGSLTSALVNAGAVVFAVEKDPHMAAYVMDRFKDCKQVKVVQEDFTKCHIRAHITSLLASDAVDLNARKLAKVVSNLPFNITTDVIKQLLPMGDIFSHIVLLLQDETAVRLVDAPVGTSEYRPINIFVNFYSEPEYKFKVERTNFFPQPNVDAAVVTFKVKQMPEYPQVVSPKSFLSMGSSKGHSSKASGTSGQQQKSETRIAVILQSMQKKMKMEELPAAALGLGLAGALPFVILAPPFSSVLPLPEVLCRQPLDAQATYGAVILSFLGGPHWGLAMVRTHARPHDRVFNIDISTFRFVWSVIPSLLAWSALLLSDTPKMSILILSFTLALGVDAWCTIQGLLPPWYLPLRVLLSLVVILCLISSALYTYFNYNEKVGTEVIKG